MKSLKQFWDFIWKSDSLLAHITFGILALIFLKITYPLVFTVLGNTIGLVDVVAVVSGSMVHDETTQYSYIQYLVDRGINETQIKNFPHPNGLNPGDLLLLWNVESPDQIKVGDVVVFEGDGLMIIHRVIDKKKINGVTYFTMKGDHNTASSPLEVNVTINRIKGVAKQRIPLLGLPKTILTRLLMSFKNVL